MTPKERYVYKHLRRGTSIQKYNFTT